MKRAILAVLAGAVALALGACASGGAAPTLTPAQVIAIACPPIQAAVVQFEAIDASMPTLPAAVTAEALLKSAQAPIAAACTAGATISIANVQEFATTVLPALGTVAGSLPLPVATQAEVQGGLLVAETAVGVVGVVEASIAAAKAAQAASAVPAASAPTAASAP